MALPIPDPLWSDLADAGVIAHDCPTPR